MNCHKCGWAMFVETAAITDGVLIILWCCPKCGDVSTAVHKFGVNK